MMQEATPTGARRAKVDVLIQTYNEELNLPYTLASVQGWANRVFVVDSGSTDDTVQIARRFGATVALHGWEGYAKQKNWALRHLPFQSPWILIIDADEAVSPELRQEIDNLTDKDADRVPEAGFYINRVFIFMGREIRHCGYFPSWNLRLFKRGRAFYEDRLVHEHMQVDGPTGYLKHLLIHEDRRGLEHFFAKHNRYSTLEARENYEKPQQWPGLKAFFRDRVLRVRFLKSRVLPHMPLSWTWRLLYMYVFRLGFLDGVAGWRLSNFISSYEFFIQLKYQEFKELKERAEKFDRSGLAEPEGQLDFDDQISIGLPSGFKRPAAATDPGEASPAALRPAPADAPAGQHHEWQTQAAREPAVYEHAGHAEASPHAVPTLVPRGNGRLTNLDDDSLRFVSPWTFKQNIARALWMFVYKILFRTSFHNWYGWRRLILRTFGAKIGRDVRMRPTVMIEIPWNLDIGDGSVIGDHAILYSLGKITIGRRVVISQYAHLCAGTHDHRFTDFPLLRPPINIDDEAWVAADSFVGPGVTIGTQAVLGARASAFKDVPPGMIATGNPAKPLKSRRLFNRPSYVGKQIDVPGEPALPQDPARPQAPPEPHDRRPTPAEQPPAEEDRTARNGQHAPAETAVPEAQVEHHEADPTQTDAVEPRS
ncbi:MAG: WcaF family extracellular polysaccharide biosynthesis acetyltransferase [Phycisphaerae bacterium]